MRRLRIDISANGTAAIAQVWMSGQRHLPWEQDLGVNMPYEVCPFDDLVEFVQKTSILLRGVEQPRMGTFLEGVLARR